jgi:glycosyltransferase involved in cell wall biosynthesis
MVVTEALAHALPVIASAVGGVPEALGHGEDGSTPGVLVRPGDPHAVAGALRRWLEDPRRRRRLRRSARLRRLTLPTWSRTTARVATALEAAR